MKALETVLEFPLRQNWTDDAQANRLELWYEALNAAAMSWLPDRHEGLTKFYEILEQELAGRGFHRVLAEGFETHMEMNGLRVADFDPESVSFADELADAATVVQLLEITRTTMGGVPGEDGRHVNVAEADRRALHLAHDWKALVSEHGTWRWGVEHWDAFAARFTRAARERGLGDHADALVTSLYALSDNERVEELTAQGAPLYGQMSVELARPSTLGMPDVPDSSAIDGLIARNWASLMTEHGMWRRGSESWDAFVERFRLAARARGAGLGEFADNFVVSLVPLSDDERVAAFSAQGAPRYSRLSAEVARPQNPQMMADPPRNEQHGS